MSRRDKKFEKLIRPHVSSMFATAYRFTGNRHDAEDLVQDVLTKLYAQTDKLAGVRDLKPWLTKALHNRFVDTLRKKQRSPAADAKAPPESLVDASASPESAAINGDLSAALRDALATLKPELRSLVALHLMEGHTLEELRAVFDVPLGTLKSRLHTARSQLKNFLSFDEPFAPNERGNEYELSGDQKSDHVAHRSNG